MGGRAVGNGGLRDEAFHTSKNGKLRNVSSPVVGTEEELMTSFTSDVQAID